MSEIVKERIQSTIKRKIDEAKNYSYSEINEMGGIVYDGINALKPHRIDNDDDEIQKGLLIEEIYQSLVDQLNPVNILHILSDDTEEKFIEGFCADLCRAWKFSTEEKGEELLEKIDNGIFYPFQDSVTTVYF